MADTAAMVLAAGSSTRLGRPKQFLEFESETLLARAVRIALEAGASPVWVVLPTALLPAGNRALAETPAIVVENPLSAEGMGSSLRAGMAALLSSSAEDEQTRPNRLLLLVCDQPRITAEHLRTLLHTPSPHGMTAARYNQRVGVPAVFGREHFAALAAASGDTGARTLLRSHAVTAVDLPEAAIDIDTPDDVQRLLGA
jgi:CTP:molybdopterin cytidylyltransferase MocA